MDWSEKKIVVTGAAGMIGAQLCTRLRDLGAQVIGLDNFERGHNYVPGVTIEEWDLAIPDDLVGVYELFSDADVVFHLAAKVTGIHYNQRHSFEMMQRNLAINWSVSEAVAVTRPGLYVYVSTACVYPHDAPVPTPEGCAETCNPEPTNWGYGVAKWVGEQQAKYLYAERGVPSLIVRFFNAFGPGDYYDEATSHVAPALIRRVCDGENPVRVWGSGDQTRVFVDCRDIAKALVMLAERDWSDYKAGHTPIVNIGHDREVTIRGLMDHILDLSGKYPAVVYDRSRPDGYPRRAADTTRLQGLIGWVPDTPLDVTLADMIGEYKAGLANK